MKRVVDLVVALVAIIILFVPVIIVTILVKISSKGPTIYWSDRVGKNNAIFKMPKFRSMKVDTPVVATHLLANPKSVLTPVGDFLRKSSLDELPQLWCRSLFFLQVVSHCQHPSTLCIYYQCAS